MSGLRVIHMFEHGIKKELIFLLLLWCAKTQSQCLHSLGFTKRTYCMFCNSLFYLLVNLVLNRLPAFVV